MLILATCYREFIKRKRKRKKKQTIITKKKEGGRERKRTTKETTTTKKDYETINKLQDYFREWQSSTSIVIFVCLELSGFYLFSMLVHLVFCCEKSFAVLYGCYRRFLYCQNIICDGTAS